MSGKKSWERFADFVSLAFFFGGRLVEVRQPTQEPNYLAAHILILVALFGQLRPLIKEIWGDEDDYSIWEIIQFGIVAVSLTASAVCTFMCMFDFGRNDILFKTINLTASILSGICGLLLIIRLAMWVIQELTKKVDKQKIKTIIRR